MAAVRPDSMELELDTGASARSSRLRDLGRLTWLRPTKVFETYWKFAVERQSLFLRRYLGAAQPWTADPVLLAHRFTNAYRASDRVSQYLINRIIPGCYPVAEDLLCRVLLFKLFNRIDTWRLLEGETGPIHVDTFDVNRLDGILSRAIDQGIRIYSSAYIMPMPSLGGQRKHTNHLRLLRRMIDDGLAAKIATAPSMADAYRLMLGYPSMGPFLAYQFITDLNYSRLCDFDEMQFVVAGPGAVRGIEKCFGDFAPYSPEDVIRWVAANSEAALDRMELQFPSLWGRPLQLVDYQNLFCEVDKYARVVHPEVGSKSPRMRIKQRYIRQDPAPTPEGFPSKWRLPLDEIFLDGRAVPYPPAIGGK